ncbi:hypothetical protein ACTD5D_40830 [Nocardia takedensis]|uniref:hypothetical protein n=1 Tax=Nocardia takedensis TaxID=259390 RepID=UPI003F764CBE
MNGLVVCGAISAAGTAVEFFGPAVPESLTHWTGTGGAIGFATVAASHTARWVWHRVKPEELVFEVRFRSRHRRSGRHQR